MKKLWITYLITLAASSTGNTKCQPPMGSSDESIYFLKHYEICQYIRYFHGLASPDKGYLYHSARFFENRQKCIRWILSCTRWLLATPWKVWSFRKGPQVLLFWIFSCNCKVLFYGKKMSKILYYGKYQIFKEPSSFHFDANSKLM